MADYDPGDFLKNLPKIEPFEFKPIEPLNFKPIEIPKLEPLFGVSREKFDNMRNAGYDDSEIYQQARAAQQAESNKQAWEAYRSGERSSPDGHWNADGTPRSNFAKNLAQAAAKQYESSVWQGRTTSSPSIYSTVPITHESGGGRSWLGFFGALLVIVLIGGVIYLLAPLVGAILGLLLLFALFSG